MTQVQTFLNKLIIRVAVIAGLCSTAVELKAGLSEQAKARDIYLSKHGKDANAGSIDYPVATLEKVFSILSENLDSDFNIYIREGTYSVTKGLKFPSTRQGSGRKIVFSAYQNENVILTGGSLLDSKRFSLVTDDGTLKQLAPSARGHVYLINLTKSAVKDFGTIKKNGFESQRLPSPLEVFRDEKPLVLSRWPNDKNLPINELTKSNTSKSSKPAFKVSSQRARNWTSSKDIWISGRFTAQWSYDNLPIETLQQNDDVVKLKESPRYGLKATGGTENQNNSGYFFYNVFEELDTDGEWYLDRDTGSLYIFSNSSPEKSHIQVSLLEEPIITISGANNLMIRNINFTVSRGHAIRIEKSTNIEISGCQFSNLGLLAISASKVEGLNVSNCSISGTGGGGIIIDGGDRKTLASGNNKVVNCEFSNYSRLYKTYSPAVYLYGVGGVVRNCSIHDAPDQAIMFKGNNHIIESNSIRNVCYDFNDMGAIYTGRDPSSTGTVIKNNFFEQVGYNANGRICAIYFDDGSGGMTVEGNIFYKSGPKAVKDFGAIHINGGGYNKLMNNVFVDCSKAYSSSAWTDEKWSKTFLENNTFKKRLAEEVDITSAVYKRSYPHLANFFDGKAKPRINEVTNSVLIGTSKLNTGKGLNIQDTHTIKNVNMLRPNRQNLKQLESYADPASAKVLKAIDIDKIGLLRSRK